MARCFLLLNKILQNKGISFTLALNATEGIMERIIRMCMMSRENIDDVRLVAALTLMFDEANLVARLLPSTELNIFITLCYIKLTFFLDCRKLCVCLFHQLQSEY